MLDELTGVVTKFKGDGRRLGYPTANITTPTKLDDGVYFGFADLGRIKQRPAIIFVGTPVTMGETTRRVEAFLLDIPDQDYYGRKLELSIEYFHRANRKFSDIESLKQAMLEDELSARRWFNNDTAHA